jgi:hypothetical protein
MQHALQAPFLSRAKVRYNVEYVLRDKDGNIKPIFQENRLAQYLLHKGLLSPLWINQWYASLISPFLGHMANKKDISNLITNAGRGLISGLINGSGSPAAATYIAVGTGATAANATDTTLQTESATSGLSRAAGTVSLVTSTITNDTAQVLKSFSVTGTVAVTEAGLLNASSSGTLLCRQVFTAVNVVNTDTLQITWKVQNA